MGLKLRMLRKPHTNFGCALEVIFVAVRIVGRAWGLGFSLEGCCKRRELGHNLHPKGTSIHATMLTAKEACVCSAPQVDASTSTSCLSLIDATKTLLGEPRHPHHQGGKGKIERVKRNPDSGAKQPIETKGEICQAGPSPSCS